MAQVGQRAKSFLKRRSASGAGAAQRLEGHAAVGLVVVRFVDHAHSALAELAQLESREQLLIGGHRPVLIPSSVRTEAGADDAYLARASAPCGTAATSATASAATTTLTAPASLVTANQEERRHAEAGHPDASRAPPRRWPGRARMRGGAVTATAGARVPDRNDIVGQLNIGAMVINIVGRPVPGHELNQLQRALGAGHVGQRHLLLKYRSRPSR